MLNARLHLPPFSLFLVALTLTDGMFSVPLQEVVANYTYVVMTITFFLNVTDTGKCLRKLTAYMLLIPTTGSWLEIGQSISFFCISSLLLVWSAGICVVGESLMAGTISDVTDHRIKSE